MPEQTGGAGIRFRLEVEETIRGRKITCYKFISIHHIDYDLKREVKDALKELINEAKEKIKKKIEKPLTEHLEKTNERSNNYEKESESFPSSE